MIILSFQHCAQIIVPSTNDKVVSVDNSAMVAYISAEFSKRFGGVSVFNAVDGGYVADNGDYIGEGVKIVSSQVYSDSEAESKTAFDYLVEMGDYVCRTMSQETVMIIWDGLGHLVDGK